MLRCLLLGSPQKLVFFSVFSQPTTCPRRIHTWGIRQEGESASASAAALDASIETVLRGRQEEEESGPLWISKRKGAGCFSRPPSVCLSVSRSGSRENGGAAVARMLGVGGDIISIISSGGGGGGGALMDHYKPSRDK
ncbi:hypothetical protein PBY51_021478 [Eleginops maclovinus]|uniref:Uncharacterized protein n=1 Tax=Eleginops maclovinus TaxID=56733 RepID=A0AAN8AKX5_ELEMC|nr:hypothetical protein PBY51_021478 [Eleginops maclovinus]